MSGEDFSTASLSVTALTMLPCLSASATALKTASAVARRRWTLATCSVRSTPPSPPAPSKVDKLTSHVEPSPSGKTGERPIARRG